MWQSIWAFILDYFCTPDEEEEDNFLADVWASPSPHEFPFECSTTQPIRDKGLLDTLPE